LDTVAIEVKSLEAQMEGADFWSKPEQARTVAKRAADLKSELQTWKDFLSDVDGLEEMTTLALEEGEESLHDEITKKTEEAERRFASMEFATLFSGAHDASFAIVSVHAGSGGTEANDWAMMLYRMLARFAEKKGWVLEILSESRAEEVGLKSITFRVEGRYAYGYLKSEAGVHRLVRISPFDAEQMRHTTFALIEVIPEFEELPEMEIDPKDLRIDTFMSGGHGGQSVNTTYSAVRIVHLPTKTTVTCQNERSQQQNKETAMRILKSRLYQMQLEEQRKEKLKLRGEYQSAEWGNQIRSYVLHPYKLVKDHRTEYETKDPQAVLDGDLEPFMEAYLRQELGASDRFSKANQE
jgi:peptide chain release factor 2